MAKGELIIVVGASNNPEKYGNRIVKNLMMRGFEVVPINPKEDLIEGLQVVHKFGEFVKANPSREVSWVDIVVPPAVTEKVVEEAKEAGIKRVWMQPGSESEKAIEYCKKNGIACVHHACIMTNYA